MCNLVSHIRLWKEGLESQGGLQVARLEGEVASVRGELAREKEALQEAQKRAQDMQRESETQRRDKSALSKVGSAVLEIVLPSRSDGGPPKLIGIPFATL